MSDFARQRINMVESQLRPNRVTDPRLVAAFLMVPREEFVPAELRGLAYVDEALPVAPGRYLPEPMILGRLAMEADLGAADRVLVVGCGTGYAVAILARIAADVVAVECDTALLQAARANLQRLGARNVTWVEGALERGAAAEGPYDVILLDGGVPELPDALGAQLAPGGRLVTIVGGDGGLGRGVVAVAAATAGAAVRLSGRAVFDAGTRLLPGFAPAPSFRF